MGAMPLLIRVVAATPPLCCITQLFLCEDQVIIDLHRHRRNIAAEVMLHQRFSARAQDRVVTDAIIRSCKKSSNTVLAGERLLSSVV